MEKLSAEGCSEFDDQRQYRLDAKLLASDFYQFSEKPFEDNPDPKFLYLTPSCQETFASILTWMREGNGYAVITGKAGTGKTFLIHALASHLDEKVIPILIPNPVTTFEDLLKAVLLILKQPTREENEIALYRRFARFLDQMMAQDKTLLIMLDEAQGLSDRIFDDLERFLNLRSKLIRIIFVGPPYFDKKLDSMGFERLEHKIETKQEIRPLTEEESRGYIDHRLRLVGSSSEIMTPKAISLICSYARGISSSINHVCDNALWVGCRSGCKKIDVDVVEKVIQNLEGSKILPKILISIQLIKRIWKYPARIIVPFKEVSVALSHKRIQDFQKVLPSIQFIKQIRKVSIQFATFFKKVSMAQFIKVAQNLDIFRKTLPSIHFVKQIWKFLIQFAISLKKVSVARLLQVIRNLKTLKILPKNLLLIEAVKRIWKYHTRFAISPKKVSVAIFLFVCLGGIFFLIYEYGERKPMKKQGMKSFAEGKLATRSSTHKPSVKEAIERKSDKSKIPTLDKPKLAQPVSSSPQQDVVDKSLSMNASVKKEDSLPSFETSSKTDYREEVPKLHGVSRALKTSPLTITRFFAPDKGPYGGIWQIYIEAESPDGDMDRISVEVDQASYGHYPTEWIKINPQHREHLKGFLQWNTFSSKAPNLPEGTQISVKVSIYDKTGNESNEVIFPFTFGSGVAKRYQPPTPFDEGNIPRIGYVMIDLCNTPF